MTTATPCIGCWRNIEVILLLAVSVSSLLVHDYGHGDRPRMAKSHGGQLRGLEHFHLPNTARTKHSLCDLKRVREAEAVTLFNYGAPRHKSENLKEPKMVGIKRGWEGLDVCGCCHSSLQRSPDTLPPCCFFCMRPTPTQATTRSPEQNIAWVKATMCACCQTSNVNTCCDLCQRL